MKQSTVFDRSSLSGILQFVAGMFAVLLASTAFAQTYVT